MSTGSVTPPRSKRSALLPHGVAAEPLPARAACWGLVSRRPRWGLSTRGWLVLVPLFLASVSIGTLAMHPFLAITARTPAELLVVEGWVHDHAIRAAAGEFAAGGYRLAFTTGGPVHGIGTYTNDYSTSANIGGRHLKDAGVPADRVHMVPSRTSTRDRTFGSAVALRDWMRDHQIIPRSLNVVTEDVHARRTRLLYQEAFGEGVTVGVIGVPNPDYNPRRWWRYSEGVRDVLGETIAYLYAKFLFFPPATPAPVPPPPPRAT